MPTIVASVIASVSVTAILMALWVLYSKYADEKRRRVELEAKLKQLEERRLPNWMLDELENAQAPLINAGFDIHAEILRAQRHLDILNGIDDDIRRTSEALRKVRGGKK